MLNLSRTFAAAAAMSLALGSFPAFADGAGGGGGGSGATATSDSRSTAVVNAPCIQKGPDGKPMRKLSSEEVCPMYQFWRDECAKDGELGMMAARNHCGAAAMGMPADDITTGSILPSPVQVLEAPLGVATAPARVLTGPLQ